MERETNNAASEFRDEIKRKEPKKKKKKEKFFKLVEERKSQHKGKSEHLQGVCTI